MSGSPGLTLSLLLAVNPSILIQCSPPPPPPQLSSPPIPAHPRSPPPPFPPPPLPPPLSAATTSHAAANASPLLSADATPLGDSASNGGLAEKARSGWAELATSGGTPLASAMALVHFLLPDDPAGWMWTHFLLSVCLLVLALLILGAAYVLGPAPWRRHEVLRDERWRRSVECLDDFGETGADSDDYALPEVEELFSGDDSEGEEGAHPGGGDAASGTRNRHEEDRLVYYRSGGGEES